MQKTCKHILSCKQLVTIIALLLNIHLISAKGNLSNEVFSGEPGLYIEELYGFMTNLPDQYEDVLDNFIKAWEEDSLFDNNEQANIIRLSQLMIKRKARPYPHFYNFMSCMMAFEKFNTNTDNYTNWIDGYSKLLDKRKTKTREFNNVLLVTDALLRENFVYKSSSTVWYATNNNYKINPGKQIEIEFTNVDLICYAKRDSMHLFETQGTLFPIDNRWVGDGGLVTWERGGYSRDEVYAYLKDYEINLARSEYSAEDVSFTNTIYFDEPLTGVLNDKVKVNNNPEDATYPKFTSYTKKFVIEDLYENIDFEGGLSMQGAKLVGTGTQENNAKLKIYRNDTLVLAASSVFFGFRADRVSSQRTALSIKLKHDSIYHPDLYLTYRVKNRELTLLKTDNFTSQGPYFNSYHKLDMNFEQLSWNMNEDVMRFTAPRGAAIGNASFESINYFSYEKFINMMMLDPEHPLYVLKRFSELYGSEEFPVEAFADHLQLPLHSVQQHAMRMAFGGFVFYDVNTGLITIKQRLHNYLAASINKIDYDVIDFYSRVEAPLENAVYNIRNNDLTIYGIPEVHVSDSQNVTIFPKGNKIIMKNNRNFQFDGVVEAGLLTFHGSNFFFSYDSFKINLQNVDYLDMKYLTGQLDNFGLPVSEQVMSRLQSITGEVLIDHSNNKSGREPNPEYPIFISKENSYVYYDMPRVEGGVYESSDFFFEVYPFVMDSLDNFNYRDLNFEGEFVSAGIFPAFEKGLSLQEDNSLGFRHQTPTQGFPLYEGKGTYHNEIWLSNNGLRGDGQIDYLTSSTWSNDFIFYPDSMNTHSQQFKIRRQTIETQYPQVSSVNNDVHWLPYADVMYIDKTDTDFNMYNDSTYLSGDLTLRPSGLTGAGRMDLSNSDLKSNLFTYKASDILSDTADFYLKSLHTDGFTVLTENVSAQISYGRKKGWFKSNDAFSLVTFPENKYVSYLDYFMWDMPRKELAMGAEGATAEVDYTDEDMEPEGPRYISLHYDQDSINFVSPLAYYDYESNFINAKGVKFIEVADSRIYPDKGELRVEPEAKITKLVNARIRTNKLTKLHTLHSATLEIQGKNSYSGMGNYDYFDENDDVQLIHFSEIRVDTGLETIAQGDIYEAANFTLSPVYQFQGKAYLRANDTLLTFKGGVLLEHDCDRPKPEWLKFKAAIDPDDIYIPYPEQIYNTNQEKIYSGINVYYDSVHIYPTFISKHKSYSDNPLVTSHGFLHYDKASKLYKIGTKEKINDFNLAEDYISLHREDCRLFSEGKVDLGVDLGQVQLEAYGNAVHEISKNETSLDIALMIDFFMSEPMIQLMANEIDSIPDLLAADLNRRIWKKTVNRLAGEKEAQRLTDELSLFGTIKELPPALKHTIVFNELKLNWNDDRNSYQSEGMIGIASINGVQINKKVKGYFELQVKRSGDIMDFYLDIDENTYYYFGYTRGVMQTLSSNPLYVETIMNMKTRDRKSKLKKWRGTSYIYMISTNRKKDIFYRKYKAAMEEKEEELDFE